MASDEMMTLANIENPAIWVMLGVVLLLFGGNKIPEMMRGIGQGMKELKKGMNSVDEEVKSLNAPAHKGDSA